MQSHRRNSRSALEISYPGFVTKPPEPPVKSKNSNQESTKNNTSNNNSISSRFPKCTPCLKSNKHRNNTQISPVQQFNNGNQRRQSLEHIYQTRGSVDARADKSKLDRRGTHDERGSTDRRGNYERRSSHKNSASNKSEFSPKSGNQNESPRYYNKNNENHTHRRYSYDEFQQLQSVSDPLTRSFLALGNCQS